MRVDLKSQLDGGAISEVLFANVTASDDGFIIYKSRFPGEISTTRPKWNEQNFYIMKNKFQR